MNHDCHRHGRSRAVRLAVLFASLMSFAVCAQTNGDIARPRAIAQNASGSPQQPIEIRADPVEIAAERFDKARNALSPRTGTSQFVFDRAEIAALPLGDATPINQLMLQAPGVVQGDYGELHVRGEMMQPQYRINGIIVPEGISGFGQVFDARFAERIEFITGALPAQYNYRTSGVVDIYTKQRFQNGGEIGMTGGSYRTINPFVEVSGAKDRATYYFTGSYSSSDAGILFPTGDRQAIHNDTTQTKGFAYVSFLPTDESRVSVILGAVQANFEIPNVPGQTATFPLDGVNEFPNLPSTALNERQREINRYSILSYEGSRGTRQDYQVALFTRYSSVLFDPDPIGDLIYRGIASRVERKSVANGVQVDSGLGGSERHTPRAGLTYTRERADSNNDSQVFPADANGQQVPGAPFAVVDARTVIGNLLGVYAQDEWRISDRFTLNYGGRYDYLDGLTQADQFSPRLGAVFQWTPSTALHAGYARYFNPPRLELVGPDTISKFANTTNQPEVQQSSPVVPERIHYIDAGVTHRFTPAFNLGLDAYAKYAKDLNDFGQFGQALVYSPFNWSQARIYGIELTAHYQKNKFSCYMSAAVSWARAKGIASGEFNFGREELDYINNNWVYVDHDQRLTSSAGVAYRLGAVHLLADAIFGSGMRSTPDGGTPNSDHLPGYVQVNLGVQREFATRWLGKLDTRLSLLNVFDRVYEIRDGTGVGVGAPQFGPRRSLYATVAASF